ncbi:MAG: LamG-like jellyroll fold domain-containing protein, partial [Bacteroidota bacterium]
KVNTTGEVYIGGAFDANIDFDPGTGTANLMTTGIGDIDIFIAKYDASLNYIWAKRIGSTSDESCLGIDLDASDNIYATGYFRGTVDFDPNAGAFNMGAGGTNVTYFLKLDPLGNFIWARSIFGPSGNSGNGIVVNSLNDVYTVGGFAGNVDFDPNTGTYTLTAVGSNDTYVHKMSQCIAYASPVNTTPIPNLTFCQNQATTLTATGTGTVNWFATSTSTAVLGTGLSFVTPTLSAGSFTYYASTTNTCGLASIRTPFTLTVNAIPSITVNSGSICAGSSFTINPSGANTYTFSNGSVVTPTSNTSYTVTGTGANGCVNSIGSVSSVTVNAIPVITVNSGSICAGNNFTITPSGASTYTIEGGGAVKTPTATTTYTVIGKSAAGCTSSTFATSSVTVNARPIITVNSGSICIGNSFTLTPSGANTYTIQGGSAIKTPTTNTTYTVTGTSTAGCTSSTFATASITVIPKPTIVVSGGSICSGSSFTIVPSGASTYTFSSGSVVSPTVTTTYTVTGTDINGCTNSTGSTLLVAVNPPITNFSVSASSTNICSGQSATVTIASSQTDIKYYLRDDATNNIVVGPISGTGSTLSFNTGTLTSTTTYNVYAETQSLGNKGLDFDGTNDVITTNIASSTTNSLTLEAWIFPRGTVAKRIISSYFNNAAQSGEIILDTYNVTNNGRGLRLAVEGAGNTLHQLSSANVLTLNAWNHVAATFNNGVTTLYVNGIAVGNSTAPFTSIPSCTNTTTFGEDPTIGALEYFNGKMDDIRIWTTARTQSEIAGNMNNCLIGNESGLKNYFKLSENAGSTVTDLVTGSIGNMSGMTPATAWVTGNVDCGGALCNREMVQLVTVNVNTVPVIAVNSGSICAGNNFTITPSGASTYTIQGGSAIKTPTTNTTYTVTGTSAAGCISSTFATASVTVNALPIISVPSTTICAGATATLTASGASTYTWNTGANTSFITASPASNTTYTVNGTSSQGCLGNLVTATISVGSAPSISVNNSTICAGNSATLIANGVNTYTWSTGATTNSIIVNPTSNTTYSVNGNLVGCSTSASNVSNVTVNSSPIISVNSGSICSGNSFTISPSGANTYTIQGGSAIKTPTANVTYTVIGTSTAGCISNTFATSSITVNTTPTISVNSGSICSGDSFTITPSGASTYTYSNGNIVNPLVNANYTITGTGSNGCVNSAVSSVTVSATPTVTIADGAICTGNSFTLSPSGASTYTYSSGSPVVSPSSTTTYSVSGTSSEGCSSNIAIATVTVANTLTVSITGTNTICSGQSANLTAGGATTYTWNTGATSSAIAPTPTTNTTYSVVGASGTCSNTAVINITVNSLPIINATTDNTLMCTGQTASLTASGASTSYTWNTGATGTIISISPTVTTNYTVTGTDANGCENNAVITQSVSLCTGINQLTNNDNVMTLFPNPSSSNITVQTDEDVQEIFVFNTFGSLVRTEKTKTFSVEQLSTGIYIIHVKTEKGMNTLRFIKE